MSHPLPATPSGVNEAAWATAIADIRAHCGWHIAPEVEETITLDGTGSDLVMLPTLHLVELTSITNDGTAVVDPEWSEAGMVRAYCWTSRFRGIVAEITHGLEAWPAELLAVATEMASSAASLAGVKAVTSGPHQVTFETSLRSDQREALDRYRLLTLE